MQAGQGEQQQVTVGLVAAPGLREIAQSIARQAQQILQERVPDASWNIAASEHPDVGASNLFGDVVQLARRRMLDERWDIAVCLTDIPLLVGHRPVAAHVSASLRVGVLSVPALGGYQQETRALEAVVVMIEGLLAADKGDQRRAQISQRLREMRELAAPTSPVDLEDRSTFLVVSTKLWGNLRLLVGMIRANQPWRLIAGLSRALVAALGTAMLMSTSPAIWKIADGMGSLRMLVLGLGSLVIISITLMAVHGLWERSPSRAVRARVMLANLATVSTITIGVLTLFVALLVLTTLGGSALVAPGVLAKELGKEAAADAYFRIAWVVSSVATVGGALGAAVEDDATVRLAAYGFHAAKRPASEGDERA